MGNVGEVLDVIVPAGGGARRLGGVDKPAVEVAGVSLLNRVLSALDQLPVGTALGTVVVVGPPRPVVRPVRWYRERPPGGGPVAAIAAGLSAVTADRVLLLAADLPDVGGALAPLLRGLADADAAVLIADGRRNHLVASWWTQALRAALQRLGDPVGASMGRLEEGVRVTEVVDVGGWGTDCDSWADIEQARTRAH